MTDLLEYQAKELFRAVGIPVLPSQQIDHPREIRQLKIPYPVVLKSQVRAGGRGKAGGVRRVENTIDAIATARRIFNLPIAGEYPEILLAETHYNAQQEYFLAIVLDYQLQRPVLLGSSQGGMQVEAVLEQVQKVAVEGEFSPFYARQLAIAMGLRGGSIDSVSDILVKMYHLFATKDLDSIEINPLGIGVDGEVMALDGKIAVNDRGLQRHPDLIELMGVPLASDDSEACLPNSTLQRLDMVNPKGNIGILCNGLDLGMATWDAVVQKRGKPAQCWAIGAQTSGILMPNDSLSQGLEVALERMREVSEVKVILINILTSPQVAETMVRTIANFLRPHLDEANGESEDRFERPTAAARALRRETSPSTLSNPSLPPPIVVRLPGAQLESIEPFWDELPLYWMETLEDAIARAIELARSL
ncbi:ATP-grasp domain-containing protein [Lusitaniella coriacea]|uniref:ATP-grasp domain-containing protein n=1 Tax=Lusitaniella coriacea TaxID=1983105 RepID=UPI003CF14EE3